MAPRDYYSVAQVCSVRGHQVSYYCIDHVIITAKYLLPRGRVCFLAESSYNSISGVRALCNVENGIANN